MNKQEFLAKLQTNLSGLPEKEVQDSLGFYSEMIDDRMEEGLSEEPYCAGNEIHYIIKSIKTCDVERRPSAEEHQGCDSGTYKKVEVFRKIVITKVHTRILCVITSSQFTFTLRKVKGTTVTFRITRNQINDKGNCGRDMPTEDIPTFNVLLLYDPLN